MPVGFAEVMRAGLESRRRFHQPSFPSLALIRRPRRSSGPGCLLAQMGAGYDAGQNAKPTPDRLPLLGGVRRRSRLRRRPAIGRWSPSVGASHPLSLCLGVSWARSLASSVSGREALHNYLWDRSQERPYRASVGTPHPGCRRGVQRNEVSCKNASRAVFVAESGENRPLQDPNSEHFDLRARSGEHLHNP